MFRLSGWLLLAWSVRFVLRGAHAVVGGMQFRRPIVSLNHRDGQLHCNLQGIEHNGDLRTSLWRLTSRPTRLSPLASFNCLVNSNPKNWLNRTLKNTYPLSSQIHISHALVTSRANLHSPHRQLCTSLFFFGLYNGNVADIFLGNCWLLVKFGTEWVNGVIRVYVHSYCVWWMKMLKCRSFSAWTTMVDKVHTYVHNYCLLQKTRHANWGICTTNHF